MILPETSEKKKLSCTSGRENLDANSNQKLVQQFRYNRVRSVPSDRPTQGHLPVNINSFYCN